MGSQRITLTLPEDIVAEARAASQGNLSRFVGSVLRTHLERMRRQELRRALVVGYQAEAELDRELAEEFRYADHEVTERFVARSDGEQ